MSIRARSIVLALIVGFFSYHTIADTVWFTVFCQFLGFIVACCATGVIVAFILSVWLDG